MAQPAAIKKTTTTIMTTHSPLRGVLVLTIGIFGIVLTPCGVIFGPIARVMSNTDLREIADGRMDRSGEGITKAGQILRVSGRVLRSLTLPAGLELFECNSISRVS